MTKVQVSAKLKEAGFVPLTSVQKPGSPDLAFEGKAFDRIAWVTALFSGQKLLKVGVAFGMLEEYEVEPLHNSILESLEAKYGPPEDTVRSFDYPYSEERFSVQAIQLGKGRVITCWPKAADGVAICVQVAGSGPSIVVVYETLGWAAEAERRLRAKASIFDE